MRLRAIIEMRFLLATFFFQFSGHSRHEGPRWPRPIKSCRADEWSSLAFPVTSPHLMLCAPFLYFVVALAQRRSHSMKGQHDYYVCYPIPFLSELDTSRPKSKH
jgi:hypothetical protein